MGPAAATARRTAALLALALALSSGGCAASGGGAARAPGASSTRIVEAELETLHQLTAYEAVQRLRPGWLRTRTSAMPQVHVDGVVRGEGIGALSSLSAAEVQEMRFLNAADATTRFGTNYASGVILVTTKR